MNYHLMSYLIILAGICGFWVLVLGKHGHQEPSTKEKCQSAVDSDRREDDHG